MIERIISGGQSGVDRAALDVALELGIACGGWCPRGRLAEDGPIDPRYPLAETPSADPSQRTAFNVRDADGTLIIMPRGAGALGGGTALARRLAADLRRPWLVVDPADAAAAATAARWLADHGLRVLNVAGPRESDAPGLHQRAAALLRRILSGAGDAPAPGPG